VSEAVANVISATTRLCAVYGHPIRHSASPAMQNAGITALGLNWRYVACDVHPDQLAAAIAGAGAMRFVGLNLTVPHKLLAVSLVDELDETARTWGAVNTIRFEAKTAASDWRPLAEVAPEEIVSMRTRGFNTDADAIIRSLQEDLGCAVRGSSVLLLGAGGAGRTAALRLAAEGVRELFLVNRTEAKAVEVAAEIQQRFPSVAVQVGYPSRPIDLILNATSAGLKSTDPLPFDTTKFALGKAGAAYDMIYRPSETPFLAAARAAGCRTANGIGMLLYQGARALEIWSGQIAPVAAMREALLKNVYAH
jgi:shikimate dehydrogenase